MARHLVIETLSSYKEQSHIDRVEVLLHVNFQVLVDFMEKERPGDIIDWEDNPDHKHAWKEMNELYTWWKMTRPNRPDPLKDVEVPPLIFSKCENPKYSKFLELVPYDKDKYSEWNKACEELSRLKEEWEKEDQINLHRLVDIRFYLWT